MLFSHRVPALVEVSLPQRSMDSMDSPRFLKSQSESSCSEYSPPLRASGIGRTIMLDMKDNGC